MSTICYINNPQPLTEFNQSQPGYVYLPPGTVSRHGCRRPSEHMDVLVARLRRKVHISRRSVGTTLNGFIRTLLLRGDSPLVGCTS